MANEEKSPATADDSPDDPSKDSSRKPYDGALAAIFEGFPEELARWLLGVRPKRVQLDRTRLAAAQERFTDQTIRVEADDGSVVLLHVEF